LPESDGNLNPPRSVSFFLSKPLFSFSALSSFSSLSSSSALAFALSVSLSPVTGVVSAAESARLSVILRAGGGAGAAILTAAAWVLKNF
jgi:hypothetical protein